MTRMIGRRWLQGPAIALASAVSVAAQPAPGAVTARWQIEAVG
jgi:hypothetical protein